MAATRQGYCGTTFRQATATAPHKLLTLHLTTAATRWARILAVDVWFSQQTALSFVPKVDLKYLNMATPPSGGTAVTKHPIPRGLGNLAAAQAVVLQGASGEGLADTLIATATALTGTPLSSAFPGALVTAAGYALAGPYKLWDAHRLGEIPLAPGEGIVVQMGTALLANDSAFVFVRWDETDAGI